MQSHHFARQCGHGEVDTDHLFVGILGTEGGLGSQVLRDLGIDPRHAEFEVRTLHDRLNSHLERLPFTTALRESLIMAVTEAQALGSHYIGTEHILLGLARSGSGQLRELLPRLQVSPEQFRGRVKRLLQQGISEITIEAVRHMARLSELGKRVLNAAEQVANSYNQRTVAPEHVLWVLTQERRSIAKKLLAQCHCDIEQLGALIPTLPAYAIEQEMRLNQILDKAVDRAEAMGSHYTGTEHILLAMTLDPWAQQMLKTHGVDINCLQQSLHDSLTH
jgi:ATP-dependent Clp protease ATP-binding subunit ClpA